MIVILLIFNGFSFTEKTATTKSETEAVENQLNEHYIVSATPT